jgi:hypothetical protein
MKRLVLIFSLALAVSCTTTSPLSDPRPSPDGKVVTFRQSELTYYCIWFSVQWIDVVCDVGPDALSCRVLDPHYRLREGMVVEGVKL